MAAVFALALLAPAALGVTVLDPDGLPSHRGPDGPPAPHGRREARDPLIPLLRRIDRYFQRHEIDGVTIDSRSVLNETEAIRLSVVSQLLAYTELYKVHPGRRYRREIVEHADYLIGHFEQILSHSVFDGMLGYAMLEAYDATKDARYLGRGRAIVAELEAFPSSERILNGGLMAAMALAKYHQLTGDAEAARITREILASLPVYQHVDGSFPHWCWCSKDIHYTDWMATELILIRRVLDDPLIDPMLGRMLGFMEDRVDAGGMTRYEEPCPDYPGCVTYYYSIATGCAIDYDTRAFTNELGYSALLFDHFRSLRYAPVMNVLDSLETGGTYADKWDFWPPPTDPYYPWTAADTSVVNTSLIFWSLGSVLSGRGGRLSHEQLAELAGDNEETGPAFAARGLPASAPPSRPGRTRSVVDSLLFAGAEPRAYCDAGIQLDAPAGDDRRPDPGPAAVSAIRFAAGEGTRPAVRLGPILPNPLRDGCEVRFALSHAATVSLAVFDASGRRVRGLSSGRLEAGEHAVRWDRRDAAGAPCASGLYFVGLRVEGQPFVARVLVIR